MKKLLFLFLALTSLPNITLADNIATKLETRQFSDNLMEFFVKEQFQEGMDHAKPYWPMPTVEIDNLVNTIHMQWPIVQNRFGESIKFQYLHTESIGESFVRYYYLHNFENHALYWLITFYKPNDKWVVNGITFKDSPEILYRKED